MRLVNLFLALSMSLVAIAQQTKTPFQFLSPLPDTRLHPIQTSITIRPGGGYLFTTNEQQLLETTLIIGERSQQHAFDVKVSKDKATASLTPHSPFLPNERVTVQFPALLRGNNGQPIGRFEYSFYTSPTLPLQQSTTSQPRTDTLPPYAIPPDMDFTVYDTEKVDTGLIFIGLPSVLTLFNNQGDLLFAFPSDSTYKMNDFKPQNDTMLSYGMTVLDGLDKGYVLFNYKKQWIDTVFMQNGYNSINHELLLLPNGNVMLTADDPQVIDMSVLVPGGNPNAIVEGSVVQEIDLSNNMVVWQWRSWDHLNILDAVNMSFTKPEINPMHFNALYFDDTEKTLLISSFGRSAIIKVDYNTSNIIWHLGGKLNMFDIINDPDGGTSRQHHINMIPNGNLLVFDNSTFHNDKTTKAKQYTLDEDNMTATLAWVARNPNPNFPSVPGTGGAHYLSNGNILASWGAYQLDTVIATEFTPDGSVAFDIRKAVGNTQNNYAYRIYKTPWKWHSSILSWVENLAQGLDIQVSPNPVRTTCTITATSTQLFQTALLRLFSTSGQVLAQYPLQPHDKTVQWQIPVNQYPAGTYFYQINLGNKAKTGKLVIAP